MFRPPTPELAADVLAALDAGLAPRDAMVALVHRVDLAYHAARRSEPPDDARVVATWLLIARAVVALRPVVSGAEPHPRLDATRDAAERFLADATAERWSELFRAATASYPFGPGDGCLALDELGGHGAPGAGGASGVGFVACMLPRDRDEDVHAALQAALLPWARGAGS